MISLPDDILLKLYDFVPYITPVNKDTNMYVTNKRKKYASKIQKWYKRNKIDAEMPLLFLSEVRLYEKWYIIRLYMKFYPKEDLRDWPYYYIKRILYMQNRVSFNPLPYSEFKLTGENQIKYSTMTAYEIFKFMHTISKEDIIATGF